jgi:hypothetical protein
MSAIVQRRLRTSVLGAALISAAVAGVVGAVVIVVAAAVGVGANSLSELPVPMVALWGLMTGVITTLPVGAACGAVVAALVRSHLVKHGSRRSATQRAAGLGGVFGAVYGLALHYLDSAGPSVTLLVAAGVIGGVAAGRVAAAVVISDYQADARTAA